MKINHSTIAIAGVAIAALLSLLACAQDTKDKQSSADHRTNSCNSSENGSVRIDNAWVRANDEIGGVSAGYFSLCNEGPTPVTLIGITTDIAGTAEIHETTRSEDGVVSMKPISNLIIAPGAKAVFAPGGMHIMLMSLQVEVVAGNAAELELEFADGNVVIFSASAKPITAGSHGHQQH